MSIRCSSRQFAQSAQQIRCTVLHWRLQQIRYHASAVLFRTYAKDGFRLLLVSSECTQHSTLFLCRVISSPAGAQIAYKSDAIMPALYSLHCMSVMLYDHPRPRRRQRRPERRLPRFPAEGDDSQITRAWLGQRRRRRKCRGGAGAAWRACAPARARRARPGRRDRAAGGARRRCRPAAVQIDDALATGLCFAAVSPGGERTFFSYRGANVSFEFGPDQAGQLDGARWLHISGYALLEGRQRAATLALIDAASRARHPDLAGSVPAAAARLARRDDRAATAPAHSVHECAGAGRSYRQERKIDMRQISLTNLTPWRSSHCSSRAWAPSPSSSAHAAA